MKRPKNSSAVFRTPCHEHTHKKKEKSEPKPETETQSYSVCQQRRLSGMV